MVGLFRRKRKFMSKGEEIWMGFEGMGYGYFVWLVYLLSECGWDGMGSLIFFSPFFSLRSIHHGGGGVCCFPFFSSLLFSSG